MKHYRKLQLLLVMFSTATFGMAQSDSTKVQKTPSPGIRVHTGTDPFVLLHQGGGAFLCKIKCVIFGSIGNNVYLCRRKEYQWKKTT